MIEIGPHLMTTIVACVGILAVLGFFVALFWYGRGGDSEGG